MSKPTSKRASKAGASTGGESTQGDGTIGGFIATAKKHRIWDRSKLVHPPR